MTEPIDLDKESILAEAERLVTGDRDKDYGHPYFNFGRIALMWSAILDREVTRQEVALCMIALKVARQVHAPKRDNLVDICGYVKTLELIQEKGWERLEQALQDEKE